jgi:predicted glycogen debranching enzyme
MAMTKPESGFAEHAISVSYDEDLDRFTHLEWLLTNSLGAFAMGTAAGVNTRRYHGLLVAAMNPPVERIMLLNGLIERVVVEPNRAVEQSYDISNHRFADGVLHPQGHAQLKRFEKDLSCRWVYQCGEVEVTREVYLFDDRNEVAVTYHVNGNGRRVRLYVQPLVSIRDFHELQHGPDNERYRVVRGQKQFMICADHHDFCIGSEQAHFEPEPIWWQDFKLDRETERGMDDTEDLFIPGRFSYTFEPTASGRALTLYAGPGSDIVRSVDESKARRRAHLAGLADHLQQQGVSDRATLRLAAASDDFVVGREVDGQLSTSILAGFPWFADWGRDTMICLPGLLLATGRTHDALLTLGTFGRNVRRGMIPNRFDDYGGEPHYNTVDASLWYIHAATEYLAMTGDWDGFAEHALPACLEIVNFYQQGTDFFIGMDPNDKLIHAGNDDTQLTWMDAKRDGVVFTPRHGKAVEINALWHHGLCALADALHGRDEERTQSLRKLADQVAQSFRQAFWNEDAGCLYDCLMADADVEGGWRPIDEIRPNQLFAVSLTHSPLRIAQQRAVVDVCREHLLTPMGMRTLSPSDPKYRARFEGDMFNRDSAYHQGTVWPWLIGPFVEAYLRCEGFTDEAREQARAFVQPLMDELDTQCLGQVAEVYDGGDPDADDLDQRPQGCIAQAWSVAELLRVSLLITKGPVH